MLIQSRRVSTYRSLRSYSTASLLLASFAGESGKHSFALGRGSSLKYGCVRAKLADGRPAGFIDSIDDSSRRPEVVKYGNLATLRDD